eukprot:CAMPEP_0113447228 /NCGR_PEP_ID=MMETSP0014_2-20120614/4127_1 /TAXON_ID=2857 /ORGANISM="Nitzschia sp." /LENGTH=877 /DNA_ID=CAMNT_0000338371 /DNA_START=487 /DNA_END=3121 /DNA_ORIENTATION=+ /assembly_acc=CAM_ASM_000159
MVLLLAKQRLTAYGIPDGYDRETCNRYGAIYLFGDAPTGWSIGRFDATKIITDEKGLSFEDACEKYREFDGYVEACEKAQWYVEGDDDTAPGPLSHKELARSVEVAGYDAEKEEEEDDDSGGSSDEENNESDEDGGVPIPGALKADCIYIKGQLDRTRRHPGNIQFRRLLIKYAKNYRSAKSKSSIIEKLLDEFERAGGRFVKLDEGLVVTNLSKSIPRDSWQELESKAKRKKVQDAFKNLRVGSQRHIEREENRRKRVLVQRSQGKHQTKRQKRSDMQEQSSDSSSDDTSIPDEESSVEEIRYVGKPLSKPRKNDCVSSFGWSDHPGNHRFYSIIEMFARKYREANREEKSSITTQVMAKFGAENRARFLRPSKEGTETQWVDLTRGSVRDKIGKALLEHILESGSAEDSSDRSSDDDDDDDSVIDELTSNDCVCVKNVGRKWGNHPGNKKFNSMIAQYHDEYSQADPARLKEISLEVEEELRQYGGRFLRPSKGSEPGSWVELTNAQIRKKINGAFRRYDPSVDEGRYSSVDSDDDDNESKSEISSNSSDDDGTSESEYRQGSGKVKPKTFDCVVGNTSRAISLDGNHVFETLISKYGTGYLIALQDNNAVEKRRLRNKVFVEFRKTGGRFIRELGGGVFWLVGQRTIDDKIRRGLDRQAKQGQSEQPQPSRQKETKTRFDSNDSLLSDDETDLPLFKRLIRDGDSNFFYKAFRYSHIELIPSFSDVRETLEKAGHTFSDGIFSTPNDKTFRSEIEYRKEMCKNGVPVKGVRPRKCHDDPEFQTVMAWCSYVRLEELNNNEKELTTMTMDKSSVERLLSRVDVLDEEGKYFATSNLESIARNGVPMEAVDELKLKDLNICSLKDISVVRIHVQKM